MIINCHLITVTLVYQNLLSLFMKKYYLIIYYKSHTNTIIPKYYNFRDIDIVCDDNIKLNIHINKISSFDVGPTYCKTYSLL